MKRQEANTNVREGERQRESERDRARESARARERNREREGEKDREREMRHKCTVYFKLQSYITGLYDYVIRPSVILSLGVHEQTSCSRFCHSGT